MIQNIDWWIFLVLAPPLYWLAPVRFRAPILTVASLGILAALAPLAVAQMFVLATLSYYVLNAATAPVAVSAGSHALALPRQMVGLKTSTWVFLVVFVFFFWFKYVPGIAHFALGDATPAELATPIGISYFSFKLLHYILERSRGTLPDHDLKDFLGWMFLMPTFTSGPIERFDHFIAERDDSFRLDHVTEGLARIAQGLIKRFVFVDLLVELNLRIGGSDLLALAHGPSDPLTVWACLAIATIKLYLDFSAYSDIAIGASRLFGLRIMENFDYPLLATNLPDFWKRWHMSLTNWCRAYIYMPVVGMTRNPYTAIIVTFALVGLWHEGSIGWLAWGLWHGVGQAAALHWGRIAQRRKIKFFKSALGKVVGWFLTMAYVFLGGSLVIFAGKGTFLDSLALMARAFGF